MVYIQRKGKGEVLDQSQADTAMTEANEEDIVVDALEVERDSKPYDKDFILPGGQIIGLDQAVMKSIERCRMLILKRHKMNLINMHSDI